MLKRIHVLVVLIIVNVFSLWAENYYSKLIDFNWVLPQYYDVLQSGEKKSLIKLLPKVEKLYVNYDDHSDISAVNKWDSFRYSDCLYGISFYYGSNTQAGKKYILVGDYSSSIFEILDVSAN